VNFSEARTLASEILGKSLGQPIVENAFNVGRIPDSFIRIGFGSRGLSILIDGNRSNGLSPLSLQYLVVRPNLFCEIESDGNSFKENVTVVELIDSEVEVREEFLTFAAVLVSADIKEDGELQVLIDGLVELLRPQYRDSKTSAVGLWGELFTILQSSDANILISSWHAIPSARHDFSKDGLNIEVKTSTSGRQHYFSATQLNTDQNDQTLVVSLLTELDELGSSCSELVEQILSRDEVTAENRMHLQNMSRKSLGRSWGVGSRIKFSTKLASMSRRVYRAGAIPQINDVPTGVSEVEFVSDLEFAPTVLAPEMAAFYGLHELLKEPM
jgi:hypothetical protein